MRWAIYFFGSGLAFFAGILFIWVALVLLVCGRSSWQRRLSNIFSIVGMILFALSAVPLSYWVYGTCLFLLFVWLSVEQLKCKDRRRLRVTMRALTAAALLGAVGLELPYQLTPHVTLPRETPLYVIGDSVTAGMGEREAETWPNLLKRWHGVDVHDFSRMGATAASAVRQAERVPATGGMVLIEIGGNDLLGTTTATLFETHLEQLLQKVSSDHRPILMLELPLPPLCNAYGAIQRRLAAKHRVHLIPRHNFARVLTGSATTLDSIHLSQTGHDQMAKLIWSLIGS